CCFFEIISENNTSDKKSKKRKSRSGTETSFSANKVGITNILIKKVNEIDDLRVKLAQNRKEREEAK
ncbi:17957_t:CDS:1, partial [Racocetra persica]